MRRIKETFSPSELPLLEVLETERACLFWMCYAMETCAAVRSEHSSIHDLRAGRRVDDLLQQNARGKYGPEVPVGLSSERCDDPGACSGQLLRHGCALYRSTGISVEKIPPASQNQTTLLKRGVAGKKKREGGKESGDFTYGIWVSEQNMSNKVHARA